MKCPSTLSFNVKVECSSENLHYVKCHRFKAQHLQLSLGHTSQLSAVLEMMLRVEHISLSSPPSIEMMNLMDSHGSYFYYYFAFSKLDFFSPLSNYVFC